MLTPEEAKMLLVLLSRMQNLLSFNEAASAVSLKVKLLAIANPKPKEQTNDQTDKRQPE